MYRLCLEGSGRLFGMKKRSIRAFLFLVGGACIGQGADQVIGCLKEVQGGVTVRRGVETMAAHEGLHLQVQDIVETSSNGRAGLILKDGTRISLGANSELRLDRFAYEPVDARFALLLRLMRGVMIYISGKIAQFSPESVHIETPVAVVGHRGTTIGIFLEAM